MIQITRILCPTDLSPEADAAMRYAIALASTFEAKLFVCHCPEGPISAAEHERVAKQLESAIHAHTGVGKCPPAEREVVISEGRPDHAIPRVAAERRIDLIVMRSRRRPLQASLLGSISEAICRTAPCPVLVIHSNEREFVGLTTCEIDLKRILVGYDFSNDSELALQYALSLAQEHQAELHLLHVLPMTLASGMVTMSSSVEDEFQRAARLLRQSIPEDVYLWCKVKHSVLAGQPYREILTYAEEHKIDLICLGVHGAGFTMRGLFGSNADRVLRQAPCPVLIARPLRPVLASLD